MTKTLPYSFVLYLCINAVGCSGCSQSGRREQTPRRPELFLEGEKEQKSEKTIIKMEKVNGVYQIPVEVNEVPMHFIFDTGAGLISISQTEALFLYKHGKLSEEDIIGTANFIDANGTITEGTVIMLRSIRIGNRTLNDVKASVVNNLKAPLLLGQSALERFGKISIDNRAKEVTFQ